YKPEYKELLCEWLASEEIIKVAHNAKFDAQALSMVGIEVKNLQFDTMLAAYILKEGTGRYGLKELAFTELGITATPITDLIGSGVKQVSLDQVPMEDVVQYAAADADHTWQLYQLYAKQFKENKQAKKLFDEIEMPTSAV